MVTIGINYHVLPGKEEPFEYAITKVDKANDSTEGHPKTYNF